ncbi:MAG: helix-turn-helix transcriptional regulator [Defluviitaleaceae bacterium]|nr:helix-turn-helix transcriptional regulator [Defluviitaleaceae bacterium]
MDRAKTKSRKNELDKIIGKNIRAEREKRSMSREELAETLDLTISHMGLIERGERGATAVTLEKLSNTFNIQIDGLFKAKDRTSERASTALGGREKDDSAAISRSKIAAMTANLTKEQLDLVIQLIKGLSRLRD